mmetsp:Transcript_95157/g.268884  ORF Transcript_95157/g.268884 Transcript_95157/m.268884 type:complete len:249 (-) Transcript_95157:810-1556(-)
MWGMPSTATVTLSAQTAAMDQTNTGHAASYFVAPLRATAGRTAALRTSATTPETTVHGMAGTQRAWFASMHAPRLGMMSPVTTQHAATAPAAAAAFTWPRCRMSAPKVESSRKLLLLAPASIRTLMAWSTSSSRPTIASRMRRSSPGSVQRASLTELKLSSCASWRTFSSSRPCTMSQAATSTLEQTTTIRNASSSRSRAMYFFSVRCHKTQKDAENPKPAIEILWSASPKRAPKQRRLLRSTHSAKR